MLHDDIPRNRLIGITLISLAWLMFSVLDGTGKWLVRSLPVIEVVWLRFAGHALVSALALGPRFGRSLFHTARPGLQGLRALLLLTMTALNFTALQYLQLTVTSAIFFSAPIIVALIGPVMLGERLDAARWVAIIAGFAGVLIVVQPFGQAFHPAMLLTFLNAIGVAVFNVLTRTLAAHDKPEATQFLSALGAAVALAPFAPLGWQWPVGGQQWLAVATMGVFGWAGHYMLAIAHRFAPATVLAPFSYQQVIYMATFGYLVFGDIPGTNVVVGAAVVIVCGIYLLRRDATRADFTQE